MQIRIHTSTHLSLKRYFIPNTSELEDVPLQTHALCAFQPTVGIWLLMQGWNSLCCEYNVCHAFFRMLSKPGYQSFFPWLSFVIFWVVT